MFNLVKIYKDGLGTEKQPQLAIKWAVLVGLQEDPPDNKRAQMITNARLNIAYMFKRGDGIVQNSVEAYKWMLIYNEGKESISALRQDRIIDDIKIYESTLTDEQKSKAKEKHFKGLALDVINNETDLENNQLKNLLPLCDDNNVIITPHIAGATYESMWRTEEFIADKLIKDFE